MIQEELTTPGLPTERDPLSSSPRRVDPVRVAVQALLALYLSPVILLVAAIGVTAIACHWLAGTMTKVVGGPGRRERAAIPSRAAAEGSRVIGSRPVAVVGRKRFRAIR